MGKEQQPLKKEPEKKEKKLFLYSKRLIKSYRRLSNKLFVTVRQRWQMLRGAKTKFKESDFLAIINNLGIYIFKVNLLYFIIAFVTKQHTVWAYLASWGVYDMIENLYKKKKVLAKIAASIKRA